MIFVFGTKVGPPKIVDVFRKFVDYYAVSNARCVGRLNDEIAEWMNGTRPRNNVFDFAVVREMEILLPIFIFAIAGSCL